ncbi:MAG: hypothetical protein AMJ60_05770 [Desulfobacterales bacterium SG8_35]|nr:MAG: hypothetical protein AMJ60_05770 [Desulfobacterales bacterium SG8_35]
MKMNTNAYFIYLLLYKDCIKSIKTNRVKRFLNYQKQDIAACRLAGFNEIQLLNTYLLGL